MNTNVYHLIRLSDESGNGDSRISADDSLDQETSPSLFSPSQNTDPVLSNDESSQSIIGSRLIEINTMVVYLRLLGELSTLILIVLTE